MYIFTPMFATFVPVSELTPFKVIFKNACAPRFAKFMLPRHASPMLTGWSGRIARLFIWPGLITLFIADCAADPAGAVKLTTLPNGDIVTVVPLIAFCIADAGMDTVWPLTFILMATLSIAICMVPLSSLSTLFVNIW